MLWDCYLSSGKTLEGLICLPRSTFCAIWLELCHAILGIATSKNLIMDFNYTKMQNFVGDRDERKITTAYMFLSLGGAISICSNKQSLAAQSAFEVIDIALSFSVRKTISLRKVAIELGILITYMLNKIISDNLRCLIFVKSSGFNDESKHDDFKCNMFENYIWELRFKSSAHIPQKLYQTLFPRQGAIERAGKPASSWDEKL